MSVGAIERPRAAAYASKPGDPRRSGRVSHAVGPTPVVALTFHETSSHVEARLGVGAVATITHDPASDGYFWAVNLPGVARRVLPALTMDKARGAVAYRVREWCEAARLMSVRR